MDGALAVVWGMVFDGDFEFYCGDGRAWVWGECGVSAVQKRDRFIVWGGGDCEFGVVDRAPYCLRNGACCYKVQVGQHEVLLTGDKSTVIEFEGCG